MNYLVVGSPHLLRVCIVKVSVMAEALTFPLMSPDEALRYSPLGKVPDKIDHLAGVMPPDPVKDCE